MLNADFDVHENQVDKDRLALYVNFTCNRIWTNQRSFDALSASLFERTARAKCWRT